MESIQARGDLRAFKNVMKVSLFRFVFPVLAFAVCLSACESSPVLYSWQSYESQVYAYLSGESRGEQIALLERDLAKIKAAGKAVPPGFYAHLGLLYMEAGDDAMAITCFTAEKTAFPEAASYMDFLLGNYGK